MVATLIGWATGGVSYTLALIMTSAIASPGGRVSRPPDGRDARPPRGMADTMIKAYTFEFRSSQIPKAVWNK